jgi:serine/threonine-protein kinase
VLLLVALLLAVGGGAGAWYFGFARYTSTPGVIGLTAAQAEVRMDKAGLGFKVGDTAYSETVAKGQIISTDPKAGERVLDDGTVTAVVSLGMERYEVPRLRGKTEDEAQAAIQDLHLEVGTSVPTYHPTVPEGQVIGTNPKAGTPLKPGATVDILLSRGPRPIKVVDWTGKDADKAEAALAKQGLDVTRTEDYSDTVDEGDVIQQTPSTGSLFKGDGVELTVSQGPEQVEIPRVVGMGQGAAENRLRDAGFEVKIEQHPDSIGLGWVVKVEPGQGDLADKGSTVTLIVI